MEDSMHACMACSVCCAATSESRWRSLNLSQIFQLTSNGFGTIGCTLLVMWIDHCASQVKFSVVLLCRELSVFGIRCLLWKMLCGKRNILLASLAGECVASVRFGSFGIILNAQILVILDYCLLLVAFSSFLGKLVSGRVCMSLSCMHSDLHRLCFSFGLGCFAFFLLICVIPLLKVWEEPFAVFTARVLLRPNVSDPFGPLFGFLLSMKGNNAMSFGI